MRWSRLDVRRLLPYALVALIAFALGALLFGSCQDTESGVAGTGHAGHAGESVSAEETTWTCSMHPQIRQSEPGLCPICGMDLIPVEQNEEGEPLPERVSLSERAKVLARVRTSVVRRMDDPATEVRLLGRVEADETRTRVVTAWVGGRIDRLHVKVTGQPVAAGQTIATLYSPEVLAAHQDLISARRQVDRMKAATPPARAAAEAALEATRDRLLLLGVSGSRVRAMESESRPTRQIGISSPFPGTVMERLATEGAYVTTGEPLLRVADLSKVWVQLDAYERDLSALLVGQTVAVVLESQPGESFEGRVAFIDPTIDAQRRTARVRIEVDNPDGLLRPGMFAQAVVHGQTGTAEDRPLVVPQTAPLFTGRRAVVYVEVPDTDRPTYDARVVRLGPRAGDVYPVVAGLTEGERVVTQGAFALDADLQIRGGSSMMVGPDDTRDGPWDRAIELSGEERSKLSPVVDAYLELQRALAADDLTAAQRAAERLVKASAEVTFDQPPSAKEAWLPLARELRSHGEKVSKVASLEAARGAFEALSMEMMTVLERFGNPVDRSLSIAFCPMASGEGATWVQDGSTIDNPYFGASMKTCGEIREHIKAGEFQPRPAPPKASPKAPPPAAMPQGHQH